MNNNKGFTLIEVLIATGIMVSTLGMLIYGIIQYSQLTEIARDMDTALNAAYHKLEEIATSDLSEIVANFDDKAFEVAGLNASIGSVEVSEVINNELYDIVVTVSWQQRQGRHMARSLRTSLVDK